MFLFSKSSEIRNKVETQPHCSTHRSQALNEHRNLETFVLNNYDKTEKI